MPDLTERFTIADRIPAPDLWEEIQARPPRQMEPGAGRRRVMSGVVAFAVATAGIAVAIRAWQGRTRPAGNVGNGAIMFMGRPGHLFVVTPGGGGARELAHIDGLSGGAAWSPDGSRIAFVREFRVPTPGTTIVLDEWAVYVAPPNGADARRIGCPGPYTAEAQCADSSPAWSPDGTRIAFGRHGAIWIMGSDGSNPHPITHSFSAPSDFGTPSWSPDGGRIVFTHLSSGGLYDLAIMRADGTDLRTLLSCQQIHCRGNGPTFPQWSPDGQSIVFTLDQSIMVMPAAGGSPRVLVSCLRLIRTPLGKSCGQAFDPVWSPDGTRIAFLAEDAFRSLNVYEMKADGSSINQVTRDGRGKCCLAWQPISVS